ncbi:Putative transposase [Moritella viscosa]|uniref:Transposase n=1 Tax=Moritella viscosa TaxID=80854 RepID=A0ABY1HG46_9GAMM|nr:Putative transposase [Moritella viscosa]SHO28538.1 Putative transposase [Moritella viscosa]
MVGKKVMIYDYPDVTLSIQHCGESFEYSIFDKRRHVQQGEEE